MVPSTSTAATLTPPVVAKRYGVSADKIIRFILAGEIAAINVAQDLTGRPRYRITEEALQAFEKKRAASVPAAMPERRRRQRVSAGV